MIYRFYFRKNGAAAYISHLDLGKVIERSLRRAKIAVLYSEGFNPHVKMSFGPALAVGCESICEMIDIHIAHDGRPDLEILNRFTPQGLLFYDAQKMPEKQPALTAEYDVAGYRATIPCGIDIERAGFIENNPELSYEKVSPKGRKLILLRDITVKPPVIVNELTKDNIVVDFALRLNSPGGSLKPGEYIEAVFGTEAALSASCCRIFLARGKDL